MYGHDLASLQIWPNQSNVRSNLRSKSSKSISISMYDNKQCFDSLWQDHIFNDLFEAGMQNDRLCLLWELNQVNKLAVKTSQGTSQRKEVNKIMCQGDPWGTCECSLHMDNIRKTVWIQN